MATHSSIPAWGIPWTEKPGGLQSTGLQRVGHNGVCAQDWARTHRVPLWSINPTPGQISRENEFKDTCTPIFTAALFIIAKTQKQSKTSQTDQLIKRWYIYTTDYYSAIKKDHAICSNVDTTRDHHPKWSRSEKRQRLYKPLIHGI